MDPKLEIIAVIILVLSNVTVNSHHFINHLRTLGLRALTIPRMKLRNAYLCSPSTYPNCISDVTERSILKDDNAALYQESGDARYFRENGYQKVPTRKSFNFNVDDVNAIQDQSHLSSRTLNIFPILNKLAKNFIPKANANKNLINRERNNLTDKGDHLIIDVSETKLHVKPAYEDEYVGINIADYIRILERFERKFYMATFDKLTSIAPEDRRENGISFVQSGLFLQLLLTALLTEVDEITRIEIEDTLKLNKTDYVEHSDIIRKVVALLPNSSEVTKFRWTSRLMLPKGKKLSREFLEGPAAALRLHVDNFSGTEEPTEITEMLNLMIEKDSGGAIRDTFDGEDFLGPVDGVLMTTVYLRAQWRSSPTLLNGTHEFYDSDAAGPYRTVRMIRINDEMNYAKIDEWNTQVIEIFYRTPGLSLVVLVCNDCSIHDLARRVAETDISAILERVRPLRVAVTLPLYTLRMTLLLPNKLQAMGIHHLVESTNGTSDSLRISHAVQRLMFWAEAGRNAYKDDGIEWDLEANLELLVNRPYVFFVRWKNITLMQGNFVL